MILLAAGNSRRFGSNKLFYEVDGIPLYLRAFDRLLAAAREGENRIFVVSRYDEILAAAADRSPALIPVPSPDSGRAGCPGLFCGGSALAAARNDPRISGSVRRKRDAPGLPAAGGTDGQSRCIFPFVLS